MAGYEERQMTLVPYEEALASRFETDWQTIDIAQPSFTGTRLLGTRSKDSQGASGSSCCCGNGPSGCQDDQVVSFDEEISLQQIAKFIDWSPFFMAWELHGKFPRILNDDVVGQEAQKLYDDAQEMLQKIMDERLLDARGIYGFWPANAEDDSIIVYADDSRTTEITRFHMLRQQWQRRGIKHFRSLADYVAPVGSGRPDFIGGFAVTTGYGCDELAAQYRDAHDDYNAIMVAALADRLAEAFAEMLHHKARHDWGFGGQEGLSQEDLINEKYRGIRPAAGYPACPDHTEKETLWRLMDVESATGIRLTESFAMWPGAAVSGLYFSHPESRYFSVAKITRDQVERYAEVKGTSIEEVERWLAPVLGY